MATKTYEPWEVAARGEALYRLLLPKLADPPEDGMFVVIDVESGDYEIDARDADATSRLVKRRPDAVTYGIRVGFLAAYNNPRIVPGDD